MIKFIARCNSAESTYCVMETGKLGIFHVSLQQPPNSMPLADQRTFISDNANIFQSPN